MLKYTLKRFGQMIVVMVAVTIIVFFMSNYMGDPVAALIDLEHATAAQVEATREALGLNLPIHIQFINFVRDVLHGDFGDSYVYREPVMKLIAERFPATLEMVVTASIVTLLLAIPLGVYSGAYPKRKLSKGIMAGSIIGISLPGFWIGMILIYIFSVSLGILPASGRADPVNVLGMPLSIFAPGGWKHLVMPVISLSLSYMATTLRLTRAGIMENMKQDYIKFARVKGVSNRNVLFHHALKNALIPVVTVFGLNIGGMFAFTTVTETIFAWPGMGKLLIDAIGRSDRPVIVAYLMLVSCMFVLINFVVDIIYTLIDPRIDLR